MPPRVCSTEQHHDCASTLSISCKFSVQQVWLQRVSMAPKLYPGQAVSCPNTRINLLVVYNSGKFQEKSRKKAV